MRRQTKLKGLAARWAARVLDIDPFRLPVRCSLPLCGVLGQYFSCRDEVIVGRRSVYVRHVRFGVTISSRRYPVSHFDGIALSIAERTATDADYVVSIHLFHASEKIRLPLFMDFDLGSAGARWQALGRVLKLPLMVEDENGDWIKPFAGLDLSGVYRPISRAPRVYLASRRPRLMKFRAVGEDKNLKLVGGSEIIARD